MSGSPASAKATTPATGRPPAPSPRANEQAGLSTLSPMDYDDALVKSIRVDRSAVERRAATIGTRRTFKREAQVAAQIWAVRCLDLTTLKGNDTPGRVDRLCAKALNPVTADILKVLGLSDLDLTVGAVCVYPAQVANAVQAVQGRIPVASVATGFPAGQTPFHIKLAEIKYAVDAGATEIDGVINGDLALTGQWHALYNEICAFRKACGDCIKLKTILRVGELGPLANVAKASAVAIMAGSDTIKTSTGMEKVNATPATCLVMAREIRRFQGIDGRKVGLKPAGGIGTAKDAMLYQMLMLEELGVSRSSSASVPVRF